MGYQRNPEGRFTTLTVEDLRGLFGEEFVSNLFEVILINCMEPVTDGVVAGSVVRLVNISTGNDRPDVTGIEGSPLDPWQGRIVDLVLG